MKPCKFCQTPFQPKNPKGEFCTDRCRNQWHRNNDKSAPSGSTPPKTVPVVDAFGDPLPPAVAAVVSTVASKPKLRPRLWPRGMTHDEVLGRLKNMRDYNTAMRAQGTPQYCSDPAFVLARLAEVGADPKLVKIVFPESAPKKSTVVDL